MAVLIGGASKDQAHRTTETYLGESYAELGRVIELEYALTTRSLGLIQRAANGQRLRRKRRWYELRQYSEELVRLVHAQDVAALAALPVAERDSTGLYLQLVWTADRSLFALQSVEPRPWEEQRLACTSPALIYTGDDARAVAALFID